MSCGKPTYQATSAFCYDELVKVQNYCLDVGGDKPPSYLPFPNERNPFLGWRAIRISLDEPELFKTQIRAILRAAVLVDVLAEASDFFSIGTNDLTQYTMDVDRGNAKVSRLYQPLHPSVLRLIKQTIDAGHSKGKWVGMCGELAGMTKAIPILLGFGLDEFSMNPRAIPEAKNLIFKLSDEKAREIANQAMSFGTAAEIEKYMQGIMGSL